MSHSVTKLPERNLDVLGAAAVLCVVINHVVVAATPPPNPNWGWLGRVGVLIFFVHTALVLMGSLERSGGTRAGWIIRFYVRRAWRIYPLAIAAIIVALALRVSQHLVVMGYPPPAFTSRDEGVVLSNMLLVQNLVLKPNILGVLWTLPIEVQMYLALPFCFVVARQSVRAVLLLLGAGMVSALAWSAGLPVPGLWRLGMLAFVPCFLAGVLAYALLRRSIAPRLSPSGTILAFAALTAAFFLVAHARWDSLAPQWAFCLTLGIIIAHGREIANSTLSRVAHVIAKYSYGVYLLHQIALWIALVKFGDVSHAVQWMIFSVLVFVLPWGAFHLIERPGIVIGQRIVHQPVPRQTPVGAP
jgi:peptidoglycan/LPS O-acetylase OafA/YrhL